jgi:hypothetical protein
VEVIKLTTHNSHVFYADATKLQTAADLRALVDHNLDKDPIYQLDTVQMTEEEYGEIEASNPAAEFFAPLRKE